MIIYSKSYIREYRLPQQNDSKRRNITPNHDGNVIILQSNKCITKKFQQHNWDMLSNSEQLLCYIDDSH